MKSKHLDFQFMPELECCYIYDKKGDELGRIIYEQKWKKWAFQPFRYETDLELDIIWSADCLQAVVDKIGELTTGVVSGAESHEALARSLGWYQLNGAWIHPDGYAKALPSSFKPAATDSCCDPHS